MHLTWYCMDPSILFHAQRGTLAKKSKFKSLMVDWHSCFHLLQGHSTQPQMWHHVCVILDTNCPNLYLNIFITSTHGLVYFHQNTKEVFKELPKTKDTISLKQHQQFFLECIILIIIDDINVKVISITWIGLFSDVMDELGPSFSPRNSLCMLMASNKSSNNTGWERECAWYSVVEWYILGIFHINLNSFIKHKMCNIWLVFDNQISNLLEKILMIVNSCHKMWKVVASTSILCDFACHGIA